LAFGGLNGLRSDERSFFDPSMFDVQYVTCVDIVLMEKKSFES